MWKWNDFKNNMDENCYYTYNPNPNPNPNPKFLKILPIFFFFPYMLIYLWLKFCDYIQGIKILCGREMILWSF